MKYFAPITLILAVLLISTCNPLQAVSEQNSSIRTALISEYMLPNDKIVEVGGAKVRVRIEGDKNDQTIILLHGFSFSLESWDGWAAKLKKNYRVIRYDLLGHGLTGADPRRRYSPIERADFLRKIMDTLSVEKAIIGGNSLGGLIAWRFAAQHPDRVKALVLVAPGGYSINGVTETPVEPPVAIKAYFRNPTDLGVQYSLSQLYADPSLITANRIKLAKDMMIVNSNGEEFIKSIAEFTLPDPAFELEKIKKPTLIIWGIKDNITPIAHAKKFVTNVKKSELKTYDNAGHVPHEEIANITVKDVDVFIRSIGNHHSS